MIKSFVITLSGREKAQFVNALIGETTSEKRQSAASIVNSLAVAKIIAQSSSTRSKSNWIWWFVYDVLLLWPMIRRPRQARERGGGGM